MVVAPPVRLYHREYGFHSFNATVSFSFKDFIFIVSVGPVIIQDGLPILGVVLCLNAPQDDMFV